MKKIISILVFCFAYVIASAQTYTPVIANYTISGKPIGYSQATPSDGRSMFYDASNFIYRPYRDSQEVITYLNLPKYRAGNVIYFVDSGGTLNGNGTYTNLHVTYWTFQDGVANSNLIKLNWNGNSGGGSGCSTCFFTTTQLTDSSFKLNRPNGTSDTVVVDVASGVYLNTANNFLTVTGTNVQAGGPLVQDTYANGGGHVFGITGNIFEQGQGATLTAANVMTTGSDGNSFPVIGSTQINAITTTNRQPGTIISFVFTGTPLLRNNQVAPAGSAPLLLAGGVDYTAATNDVIFFLYDGVNNVWHETSRKLAGSVIPVTANNAITLAGANLQWGGTLIKNTTVAGNAFYTAFSGGRLEGPMGIPILAAGDLVTGNDGNIFHVTGTTQINAITTTNYQAGSQIGFVFDGIVTVKNNTAGGINTAPMLLAGRTDYTSAAGDYMGFFYDGVNWYETERKLAGTVSSGLSTANNGLTVNPAGNVQLGGSLIQTTTITQSTHPITFNGAVTSSTMFNLTNILGSASGTISTLNAQANTFGGSGSLTAINGFASGANSGVNIGGKFEGDVGTGGGTQAYGVYSQSDNGIGVFGTSLTAIGISGSGVTGGSFVGTNNGVIAASTTGVGMTATSTSNLASIFQINPSSTNTVLPVASFQRLTTGTPANGIGGSFQFALSNTTGVLGSAEIAAKLLDATGATATSELDFNVITSGNPLTTAFSINGKSVFTTGVRLEMAKGGSVASTGNLTLGTDGNTFHITGTTQINAITTANWQAGSEIILIFDGSLTVKNNTAGGAGTAVMLLAGSADFSATANDVLTLIWDGTSFFEKSRSVN